MRDFSPDARQTTRQRNRSAMKHKMTSSHITTNHRALNRWRFTYSDENRSKLQARLEREGTKPELVAATIEKLEQITHVYFESLHFLGRRLLRESPNLTCDSFEHPARH